ncbi:CPBP family intramembrane metalloprotease domain-containing protein [Marinilabilia rubra]|uniref:CPBP family intramembrane metalloprotease domain-containing protein n=1 Tax=Marinilabilia rubra TaxID=2162893 RepID=A0A2U2B599_9BACT|nr:CPBP family intramembrane metalloprotease domain-containing protein [Marinilabilia rubra]
MSPNIIKAYRSPLTFYALSLFIPWGFWFLSGYISHLTPSASYLQWLVGIFSFAGLVAPVLIAISFIMPDQRLRNDLLGRIFNFNRIKPHYLLVTVFLMLVSILLAQAISLFFGYSADQFQFRGGYTFSSGVFPVWFMLLAAPLLEELAWHSYGTDCLRSRYNLFTASVIFAVFWAFWHFPLSFIKDYYHSNLVEEGLLYSLNFVVSLIPFVIILNWLYYKTERNILLPVIFHITAGFFNEIFATHPISKVIQTGLLLVFSVFLLLHNKTMFFQRLPIPSQTFKSI